MKITNSFVNCLRPKLVSFAVRLETQSIQFIYKKFIEQRNQKGRSTTTQISEVEEINYTIIKLMY